MEMYAGLIVMVVLALMGAGMNVAYQKYENFTEDLVKGVHLMDAANHELKVALTNTAPTLTTDEILGDITEIGAGNGYTAGGDDAQNTVTRSGGVTSVVGQDVTWTAGGGTIGPFRYVVLYNDTPAGPVDPLIAVWDNGSNVTLQIGESFTIDFGTEMFTVT